MKKGLTLLLTGLMVLSILIIPIPSGALEYTMDSDLSNVDASFWGESANDNVGYWVNGAGDVNGDGYDDILISGHLDDDGGTDAGQAYLIFGKASGWALDTDISNADASFIGENAGDWAGSRVAGGGDVNNDGFDDFLVSAYYNDEDATDAGQVYLILGKASGWTMDNDLSNADASFHGENSADLAGYDISLSGDVNGDGFDDILISADREDSGGSQAGQTYLIFGKATGWSMDSDLSDADASYIGESLGDYSGRSIAIVGDVNGDNYDDFIIAASGDDDGGGSAGQIYLILGKATGWSMDKDLSGVDASFIGESAGDRAGNGVGAPGDVNGDGYDDILIGAYDNDDGGSNTGQSYIIFGKASGWSMDTDLSNADASFLGENIDDKTGTSVDGAGDVNGDGFDDFLIGTSGSDDGGTDAGQVYLILGKTSGWSMDTDLSNADISFLGENIDDQVSARSGISSAGDFNRDGYDDILIGAMYNDEGGTDAGQAYLILPDDNSKPTVITTVKAYSDDSYTIEISQASENDTIYIELQGTDGNSSRKDMAIVNVTSNESSPKGFSLRLFESDLNTGIYRGNITIKNRTHDGYRWINASIGEAVTISSVQIPSKNTTIYVGGLTLFPLVDNTSAQEDIEYMEHYWCNGGINADWIVETNASWLEWNATTHNISGTPDNSDVGSYWVRINITHIIGGSDEHNFTLTVNNTPPDINTSDVTGAVEDLEYGVDYNSTDDGQGIITWHLETDAGDWLSLNSSTGLMNGTPVNDDVGQFYVNVSVDDGNDGWDHSNFTLTVTNTNDAPVIATEDNETAYEDSLYSIQYEATEVDQGDILAWYLETNATSWLTMNSVSGLLSGTPGNDDVGDYWVNVTVKDNYMASDYSNFTLTVINTNDQPEITSVPITEATALYQYVYQVTALDVDIGEGDILIFSLVTKPDGMTIESGTGLIKWTPEEGQKGQNPVLVKVSDGIADVTQSFNISVEVPVTYEPFVTLLTPMNGSEVDVTNPQLTWSVEDPDSDTFFFNVYLSDIEGKVNFQDPSVKVTEDITSTVYIPPSELVKGTTYYWTVSPFDGDNIGKCLNGTWSFKVKEEAVIEQKPTAVLNAPSNRAMIDTLPVQLEWSGADPDSSIIYFDVYLGTDDALVASLDPSSLIYDDLTEEILVYNVLTPGSTYYWTVIPNDGTNVGDCTSGVWWFKVDEGAGTNNAPVITSSPVDEVIIGQEYRYQVEATDSDGDIVRYGLLDRPTGMVIDAGSGLIIWTPTVDQKGNHTVKVRASDGDLFTLQSFKIEVIEEIAPNNEPVITSIPDRTIKVSADFIFQVAATDADIGDVLTYGLEAPPEGMSITPTGLIEWVPTKSQVGEHTITVNVSDGKDDVTTQFTVTVDKDKKEPTTDGLGSMFPILIVVIIVIVVVVLVLAMTRRGKTREEHLEEEEAPEEPPEEYPDEKQEEPEPVEAKEEVVEEPEGEEVELEDEVDLDDLEDED